MRALLISLLLTTLLGAQTLEEFAAKYHYETNYEVALKKAHKAHKPLFLIMVTNYCPWCRKYEKRTLSDPTMDAEIHKRYIPLILNREKGEFPEQFKTPIVPISYVVNSNNEKIVKKVMGYKSKKDLKEALKY